MKIGYARVSTPDQNLDMQLYALTNAGCETIFEEKFSGKSNERPELIKFVEKSSVVWYYYVRIGNLTIFKDNQLSDQVVAIKV